MLLLAQVGQNAQLATHEIRSVAARDVAPSLAVSIVPHAENLLHTERETSAWGQLPAERVATMAAPVLSNWILKLGGTKRLIDLLSEGEVPRVFPLRASALAAVIWDQAVLARVTGKAVVGLSILGAPSGRLLADLYRALKERAKEEKKSLRLILPSKGDIELSAASVRQNRLVEKGWEICVVVRPEGAWLGLTRAVFDPNRDARLDRGIPVPNPHSGMLPPKLARMMVNIAVGDLHSITVLDPFCGNGRILLEAALLNYPVIGRDIEEAQILASRQNLDWLSRELKLSVQAEFAVQDAGAAVNTSVPHVIATETWLGPPLRRQPRPEEAEKFARRVGALLASSVAALTSSRPQRIVIAIPAWRVATGERRSISAELLDALDRNGYGGECIARYSRADSIVEREIILSHPK